MSPLWRREVSTFGAVGILSTVVDVGLFNALHGVFAIESLFSKTVSTVAAMFISYGGSRLWSFRHRSDRPVRTELPRFVGLTMVGLGITLTVLALARYGLHQRSLLALNVAANGVGLALATVWRFWAYRRWVFAGDRNARRMA